MQYPVIIAFGILKKAAAKVNIEFGLDKKIGMLWFTQTLSLIFVKYFFTELSTALITVVKHLFYIDLIFLILCYLVR